jgi:hypothetical protein
MQNSTDLVTAHPPIPIPIAPGMVSQKFIEEQTQILRLTTPRLKSTPGAPFAQDDSSFCDTYFY